MRQRIAQAVWDMERRLTITRRYKHSVLGYALIVALNRYFGISQLCEDNIYNVY